MRRFLFYFSAAATNPPRDLNTCNLLREREIRGSGKKSARPEWTWARKKEKLALRLFRYYFVVAFPDVEGTPSAGEEEEFEKAVESSGALQYCLSWCGEEGAKREREGVGGREENEKRRVWDSVRVIYFNMGFPQGFPGMWEEGGCKVIYRYGECSSKRRSAAVCKTRVRLRI